MPGSARAGESGRVVKGRSGRAAPSQARRLRERGVCVWRRQVAPIEVSAERAEAAPRFIQGCIGWENAVPMSEGRSGLHTEIRKGRRVRGAGGDGEVAERLAGHRVGESSPSEFWRRVALPLSWDVQARPSVEGLLLELKGPDWRLG